MENETKRIVKSVLVGPLILIPGMVIYLIPLELLGIRDISAENIGLSLVYGLVGLGFAYPIALFFGVPLLVVLKKLKILSYLKLMSVVVALVLVYLILYQGCLGEALIFSYASIIVA